MKRIKIEQHRILVKKPHPQSTAAYILYKQWLQSEEWFSQKKWGMFRYTFLSKKQEQGGLRCAYCGQKNLAIYFPNHGSMLATIDHVIPLARGGDRYNEANLVVACGPCNSKKGDKTLPLETYVWLLLSEFFLSTKTA